MNVDATLAAIQPYLTAITTIVSVGLLGVILNLQRAARDNAQDRVNAQKELLEAVRSTAQERNAVQEDRIKAATENQQRMQVWADREKADLTKQLNDAQGNLERVLKGEGLDLSSLILGKQLSDSANIVRETAEELVQEMRDKLDKLSQIDEHDTLVFKPSWELTLAMGAMAYGEFAEAAAHFDAYSKIVDQSWQESLTRGVAHANARAGYESNLASLRSYNDAIALAPVNLNHNLKARMFAYRGAILKRLGRVSEAASDLSIALGLADSTYELTDIHYNLACLHAMNSEKDKMLAELRFVISNQAYKRAVVSHKADYFKSYADDPELNALLTT